MWGLEEVSRDTRVQSDTRTHRRHLASRHTPVTLGCHETPRKGVAPTTKGTLGRLEEAGGVGRSGCVGGNGVTRPRGPVGPGGHARRTCHVAVLARTGPRRKGHVALYRPSASSGSWRHPLHVSPRLFHHAGFRRHARVDAGGDVGVAARIRLGHAA